MRSEGDIANLIMQATIWRRLGIIERSTAGIVLLGRSTAAETIQLQRFLTRNSYPHHLLEPTAQQFAKARADSLDEEQYLLPAVIFPDGRVLHQPSLGDLADELGLTELLDPEATYDVTVIGAGPSGLAAAVYAASEGLSTLVIEGIAPGGQAGASSRIENYLGFPTGVSGQELANRAQAQAQKFGARLAISRDVVAIDQAGGLHHLKLAGGTSVRSRAVIIATGAQYRRLAVENYARFEGQGIQYAATAMEATSAAIRRSPSSVAATPPDRPRSSSLASPATSISSPAVRPSPTPCPAISSIASKPPPASPFHSHTEIERLEGDSVLRCVTWASRASAHAKPGPSRASSS